MRATRKGHSLQLVRPLLYVLSLVLLIGCAGPPPSPRMPPEVPTTLPSEEEAARVREGASEAIPPQVEETRIAETEPDRALPPPPAPAPVIEPEPAPVTTSADIQGFRVQVFATSSKTLAQQHAARLRPRFDEKVYVDYEGLLYKVRIGDCATLQQAKELRRQTLDLGQEGAFVVSAKVSPR